MNQPSSKDPDLTTELDLKVVAHAARLARLAPDQDEQEHLRDELGRILGYFRRLEQLDTDGVEPDYHPHEPDARLRPDSVAASSDRGELLATATKTKDGCLMVPRTVD